MGRYRSDDSDDEYSKKSKKKKKRRARSRSSSDSESSHVSSSKSKKSKKKHRRSSRSRSAERRRPHDGRSSRRSRSSSLDRYSSSRKLHSDSRSNDYRGGRKSRSPPPKRGRSRSRSPSSRRRRSRSYSRGRRSRSRSPSRGHRRSYSRERRSRSYDRTSSQRSSLERRRDASHSTASPSNVPVQGLSISEQIPGFNEMTPAEQAEERMRLALKAAAAADEKLKVRTSLESAGLGATANFADSKNFANSVAAIESNSFVQSSFKSSRSTKVKEEPTDTHATHDDAIFGSLAMTGFTITPDPDTKPVQLDPDSIMHPSLYCDPEEKMDRWIQRLAQLRKRKLEGEAM